MQCAWRSLGVAEPYAAFTDGPEAQAVQGALDLNTLVVAPAGNDGVAGPTFGSVAGLPGRRRARRRRDGFAHRAAERSRRPAPRARRDPRRALPLLGASAAAHALTLGVATPRSTRGSRGASTTDYFDTRASAWLPAGPSSCRSATIRRRPRSQPRAPARRPSCSTAAALPAGALPVAEDETAPVVVVPAAAALELLAAQRAGIDVGVAIGARRDDANGGRSLVAGFSSQGLAFDSGIKPDVAAPGVALATAEPGSASDGSPLYGTVNGTSGAAATVAGAAALLAQMRPRSTGLRSRACSSATRSAATRRPLRRGRASSGSAPRLSARSPRSLRPSGSGSGEASAGMRRGRSSCGTSRRGGCSSRSRRSSDGESEALKFTVKPQQSRARRGPGAGPRHGHRACGAECCGVTGAIQVAASGSETLRVPWALRFKSYRASLLGRVALSSRSFKPSDTSPAVLNIQAGNARAGTTGCRSSRSPRLDVLLYSASGRYLGVMARLRNLLPGVVQLRDHRPWPDERPARGGQLRAARRRLADAATERETEQGAGLVPNRVVSAIDGHLGP